MNMEERYKIVFNSAKEFIKELLKLDSKLNEALLNKHLNYIHKCEGVSDINERLIESIANRSMMKNVIKFNKNNEENNKERLREMLFDFNPEKILKTYKSHDNLFNTFKKSSFKINYKNKRNLWMQFAKGIISGSKFLSSFKNKKEFDNFIGLFKKNEYTRAALPMLLAKEIDGLGFALACDFLKEIGYREYPKPDVHLMDIFYKLKLSKLHTQYEVYKSIIEMSEIVNKDAYYVDKLFWLISSGNFYFVKDDNGKELNIGRHKDEFIKKAKKKLNLASRRFL